jgi:hypothetical protein
MKRERTSETVSSSCEILYSFAFKSFHYLIESRACLFLGMVWEPIGDIEIPSWVKSVRRDGITVEVIRDNSLNQIRIK